MFTLPKLPYSYDALEPWIDARTMELHYTKHHQAYVNKLNEALEKHVDFAAAFSGKSEIEALEAILGNLNAVPEDIRTAVRNHGGGHWNHSFFWIIMGSHAKGEPSGALREAIDSTFSSFEKFKEALMNAGLNRFGSGWAWLVMNNGKLEVYSTPNQDSPLMERKTPILGVDVWEHSYYILYQWRRGDYLKNWWNVVNWEQVEKNYKKALRE